MRSVAMLPLLLVATLIVSTFALATPADAASRRQQTIYTALDVIRHQKGDPYRYGASGPNSFDCSGLMYYSFRRAGIKHIPRTSDAQARFSERIKRRNMRKGDLVFFHNGGNVYHVGVFSGWKDGKRTIIHAPYGGKNVHRAKIWSNNWFAGTLNFKRG
jgi:cell wall-associated NlpC family hydrolase